MRKTVECVGDAEHCRMYRRTQANGGKLSHPHSPSVRPFMTNTRMRWRIISINPASPPAHANGGNMSSSSYTKDTTDPRYCVHDEMYC